MSIFADACLFLVSAFLLGYVPGKLLLLLGKSTARPLENFTLACILGLVLSGLVYWVFGFTDRENFYSVWPVGALIIFCGVQYRRWRRVLRDSSWSRSDAGSRIKRCLTRSRLALLAVLALGITMLALLPQYYTNLTRRPDGTMLVQESADFLLHLAIANELTHTIPPDAPVFSGHRMSYHYGMDLPVAMFAHAAGLDTRDLTLRFVPTLFLLLGMLSAFCFARLWLGSEYWAALFVLLVFFGEDFGFLPGIWQRSQGDWSVRYFWIPTVFSLFQANPVLPGLALLFAGLFCLQKYLREPHWTWFFFCAFLFAASLEVKVFVAAHIAVSLGFAAIVYLLSFRQTALFKVATLTAINLAPLLLMAFLNNKKEADIVTSFDPWPYVSPSMEALGVPAWSHSVLSFIVLALPVYLFGCLGLRVLGVPAILRTLCRPDPDRPLRYVLAFFVVVGVVITLTCRVVPKVATHPYNNSVWFFGQSKYLAWIFAVEAMALFYERMVARGLRPILAEATILFVAAALSLPATVQHFALQMRPPPKTARQSYDRDLIDAMSYLSDNATPGEVVLPERSVLGAVLALTFCRVPIGYFADTFVSREAYEERKLAQSEFWEGWRNGKVRNEFLRDLNIRYLVVRRPPQGLPATLLTQLEQVYANESYAVLRFDFD